MFGGVVIAVVVAVVVEAVAVVRVAVVVVVVVVVAILVQALLRALALHALFFLSWSDIALLWFRSCPTSSASWSTLDAMPRQISFLNVPGSCFVAQTSVHQRANVFRTLEDHSPFA